MSDDSHFFSPVQFISMYQPLFPSLSLTCASRGVYPPSTLHHTRKRKEKKSSHIGQEPNPAQLHNSSLALRSRQYLNRQTCDRPAERYLPAWLPVCLLPPFAQFLQSPIQFKASSDINAHCKSDPALLECFALPYLPTLFEHLPLTRKRKGHKCGLVISNPRPYLNYSVRALDCCYILLMSKRP